MSTVTFIETDTPRHSPWGSIDDAAQEAPGIWWVSTPSHGGYIISQQRRNAMPEPFRSHRPYAGPLAYEEDCDWSCVVLAWPTEFAQRDVDRARACYQQWIANKEARAR